MATLEINGRRVEVDDSFKALTPEQQQATVEEIAASFGAQPQTNLAEQIGTGASEGIATGAGLPVDAMTGLLNKGAEWTNQLLGPDASIPPMGPAVGGSESVKQALDPFMSDAAPQTAPQRIGRRVSHDVGAGAVVGPLAGVGGWAGAALNTGADALSGLAGGLTSEFTDNPYINAIVSMLAGSAVPFGAAAKRSDGAPSIKDLKKQEGQLYKQVEESEFRLTPRETQELQGAISGRMQTEGMYPPQHVGAKGAVDRAYELPGRHPEGTPSLHDVEDVRQYVNKKVTPSTVPDEARLGGGIKREIDSYLREKQQGFPGRPGVGDIDASFKAHETSRKRMAAEELAKVFQKAEWRASSTGLGGNDINALRQNIRGLLEKNSAGYTAEQKAKMVEIVEGTTATNAARGVGSLSPQRGLGLAGIGSAGMSIHSGNAWWLAPAGVGIVAQAIGETLTRKQVAELSAMIRSGGPVAAKTLTKGEQAVLDALVAIQASQAGQHNQQSGPQ